MKTQRKVLISSNPWKASMTSGEMNAAIADSLRRRYPDWDIRQIPLSDGGDGFLDAVRAIDSGHMETKSLAVPGPLPEQMALQAEYLWHPERKQLFVEAAEIHGIRRLPEGQQGGTRATSYGVGKAIIALAQQHPDAQEIVLTVGGSASTDGGIGFLQGLGWKFYDTHEQALPVPLDASRLGEIQKAEPLPLPPGFPRVTLLVDVESQYMEAPSRFGPQKGVSAETIPALEAGFANVAQMVDPSGRLRHKAGSGAAGGLGFAIMAAGFPGFSAMAGIDWVARESGLEEALKDSDMVITGEGRFDETSLVGKGPGYLVREAARLNIPAVVVCGKTTLDEAALEKAGLPGLKVLPLYEANAQVTPRQMEREATEDRLRKVLGEQEETLWQLD